MTILEEIKRSTTGLTTVSVFTSELALMIKKKKIDYKWLKRLVIRRMVTNATGKEDFRIKVFRNSIQHEDIELSKEMVNIEILPHAKKVFLNKDMKPTERAVLNFIRRNPNLFEKNDVYKDIIKNSFTTR